MGELYKIAKEREEQEKLLKQLTEASIQRQEADKEALFEQREAARNVRLVRQENYAKYKSNVKRLLVTEALKRIYVGSLTNPTPSEKALCEAFIGNYVEEQGADNLLSNMHLGNTQLLEGLYNTINKHYHILTEDADQDKPDTLSLNKDNLDDFFEEIDKNEDMDDVTNTIRLRVGDAEEDFVDRARADKNNLKDIISQTAQRVESEKPSLDNDYDNSEDTEDAGSTPSTEVNNAIASEAAMDARDKIYEMNSKPRTVFDKMVRKLSEAALINPELKKQYMGENGRLDMTKVVESVRCMYTMLEMVSTIKLENVDERYITETIESIK